MVPTPGRIVLYTLLTGATRGQERPAIVIGALGETVELQVFASTLDDGYTNCVNRVAAREADVSEPGCWRWPPREPVERKG